ncbi:MAG TPA: prepilin peptidase [Terracidiphilus sp.]|jgi:leader peptidase (prepilin peptidase)/N-methyltransferase|nr:prepilin peptidase [Terracidiphilus sp.]
MVRILGTLFAALAGLAFGSFLNVCLSRWPAGESVVQPRSHCRTCGRTLAWWENIPLVSWLALRGRCRTCHTAIGWRYPLVELAVGVLWAAEVWQLTGDSFAILVASKYSFLGFAAILSKLLFYWLMVALAVLDAEHLWLPNSLTLPGIALGLLSSVFGFISAAPPPFSIDRGFLYIIAYSLVGIFLAAGIILLIRWIYWLIRRREGIGMGDAKLMAMLGAWLGLPGAVLSFAIGVVLGAIVALVVLARPRRSAEPWALTKLPLGTFLCIGGIISALWGSQIIAAYLRWNGWS